MLLPFRAYSAFLSLSIACALPAAEPLRLIHIDPGHSHAAQVQTTMLPGFSDEAHIYAPLGPELAMHLNRVASFNSRPARPTHWKLVVYAGSDFLDRMRAEPPGNVVVLSGRNNVKMDYVEASLRAGQNVLGDKPWIIEAKDLPRLEAALNMAESKRLLAYDAMTQRFDIAYRLQRALVNDRSLFGTPVSVEMESTHYLLKSGQRPLWYLDTTQQGEGIADVGTHQVDLIEWTLFPDQAVHHETDVRVTDAKRWPMMLSRNDFQRVSGEKTWAPFMLPMVRNDEFAYYTNNEVLFTIKGVQAKCRVLWTFEQKPGLQDTMFALYTGSKARVQVRQNKEENFVPEVDVAPLGSQPRAHFRAALQARLQAMAADFPGLSIADHGDAFRVVIPSAIRLPGEQHNARLMEQFLGYVRHPETLPSWEKPNMITKYYITTRAVELAREREHSR